jgi:hypothetical protein
MLDRDKVLNAFHKALEEKSGIADISPRSVALRARDLYCSALHPGEKQPSTETFRKYVAGKSALPEILEILERANVRPAMRARLNRERLRAVFHEAVQRLESRILRGQAKPLQIARRAHELYTRDSADETLRPSHYTFRRLIYGKAADPEILTLIEAALRKKD